MLNYIWLGLIVVAILVGAGRDISELSSNRFQNGKALPMQINVGDLKVSAPNRYSAKAFVTKQGLASFYGADEVKDLKGDTLFFATDIILTGNTAVNGSPSQRGTATLTVPDGSPAIINDLSQAAGEAGKITGQASFSTLDPAMPASLNFVAPSVYFRVLNKVANEGILKIADTAVTLALGLIGIMTLWLGVMKIAEMAGLVDMLAKLVKPVMVRLFPEVPANHPAMGAMVLNMTANFLGLSNAATPMGLKAMEELNKLNPHAGTATNAMCMFLTINTTALTLIPATVIAIRLTLGSSDPSEIIMPTFLATFFSLILGVAFTRFIERFYPLPKTAETTSTN